MRAEEARFDGVFLRDHMVRPRRHELAVCDPWTALAAIALRTERITIGTRITPLSRRRPHDVAQQAVAVDYLSSGRLVLGVGLGADNGGELSRLGEITEARARAGALDEGLDLLCRLWSGEPVTHRGHHYRIDGLRFLPRPVQRPRIPIWSPRSRPNRLRCGAPPGSTAGAGDH